MSQTKGKMDPKVFASQPKRIGGSGKVNILNTQHLDPEYEALCRSDWEATATGWVKLIDITPKKEKTLPSFVLRWDSNSKTVDVDIHVDGKNRKDLWDNLGYSGHHPTRINGPWRKFEVDIKIPERNIFRGIVNIGLLIEVNHQIEIELTNTGKFLLTSNLNAQSPLFLCQ